MSDDNLAVVHVSGTLVRRNWFSDHLTSCIVVRPGGKERDRLGMIVNQVRFAGPSQMVFSARSRSADGSEQLGSSGPGHVGTLPGFDNAVLVYIEAEESSLSVQVAADDDFVPLRELLGAGRDFAEMDSGLVIDPSTQLAC